MIDIAGPYLLILILNSYDYKTGLAVQEMRSYEDCRAALTQLEVVDELRGYCIAKQLAE